ncbi:MAG: hypothetical protein IK078_04835, partial [Lachnospiraceae bacterium]|nr:hypothetical protein [Lachnospiraceae bacterium]
MTVFLLIVLLVMELGFMIFELSGKSSKKTWTVKRIIINAAELAVFVMMALLPGIDFSFRFKGLMAILALRIVVSAIFLAANRKNDKDKKKVPIVLSALLSICMIATSLFPAFLFYDYQGLPLTGTYQVSQADAIMVDTSRIEQFEDDGSYREVPIYLFYPEGTDAKMPLIIFSHGAFGYYQSNESMYRELASHGFVVASIEHP